MNDGLVSILDANRFAISDGNGDMEPSPRVPTGYYSFDIRFLSTWVLTVNGERLHALSVDDITNFEAKFFVVPGVRAQYTDAKLSVIRYRRLAGDFEESLTVLSHSTEWSDLTVRVEIGADFGSVLQFAGPIKQKGVSSTIVTDSELRHCYVRESFRRETVISSTEQAEFDERGMTFHLRLPPHGKWSTRLRVDTVLIGAGGVDIREMVESYRSRPKGESRQELLDEWLTTAPRLSSDFEPLVDTYRRSLLDLAALRYTTLLLKGYFWTGGLPWFMGFFGRDSIITSLQTLPFKPEMTPSVLRALFTSQGVKLDNLREEEPGKLYHEVNYGEPSAFQEMGQSPYFGAADVTPLGVILLDEYELWTGDVDLVREFEAETRAAIDWIDTYADLMGGTGYIWYQRQNVESGLVNQSWKGSADAISYRDGRLPASPRATCELQGYAYDAKLRAARMARRFWNDPAYADRLERDAAQLKERFNRDFWVADGEYYALALDPDGQQVDALASNIGHLLWSGIVPPDRAAAVAAHLVGPRLFSGWGVRSLAVGEGRFNPLGYHVGTVWPFDNSFIAWGLRRYGFAEEAGRIAEAILDAARYFKGRLPETFAGYDRQLTKYPVPYPSAGSPQAWSAGASLLLIRTMLGLEPDGEQLVIDPALPNAINQIDLLGIPGRWGLRDAFARRRDR